MSLNIGITDLADYLEELDAALSEGPWRAEYESFSAGETNDDPGDFHEAWVIKCPIDLRDGTRAQGYTYSQPCAAVDNEPAIEELRALADVRNLLYPLAKMLRAMRDDESLRDLRSGRGDWPLLDELAYDTMTEACNAGICQYCDGSGIDECNTGVPGVPCRMCGGRGRPKP